MKTARIYQRVSTEEQNIERQNRLIQKAKDAGYYIAGIYSEKASGAVRNRPELNKLIDDLQSGDVIIAEHIDRITRLPLPEAEKLIEQIEQKGAILAIPNIVDLSQIDVDSDIAKIVLNSVQQMLLKIALQLAYNDYTQRRQRQKEGIAEAVKKGKYKGRRPNIKQHELIIKLREHHTIKETARLAGCSEAQVKLIMKKNREYE